MPAQSPVHLITVSGQIPAPDDPFGTGFHVYRDETASYFLTAAHVVKDAIAAPTGRIIRIGTESATIVAVGDPEATPDIAVLKTAPVDAHTYRLRGITVPGYPAEVRGYAYQTRQARVEAPVDVDITRDLAVSRAGGSPTDPVWELRSVGSRRLQPGYSGSALVIRGTDLVVGLVFVREGEGESGQAIAIQRLTAVWGDRPQGLDIPDLRVTPELAAQRPLRKKYFESGSKQLRAAGGNNFFEHRYIPAYCRRRQFLGAVDAPKEDATAAVGRVLDSAGPAGVAFLGEFGTGKTCLCQQLFLTVGEAFVRDPEAGTVPILCRLAEARLDYDPDPDRWVERFLHRQIGRYIEDVSPGLAKPFWAAGRVLFLLDGFDEMPVDGTTGAVRDCIRFLDRLVQMRGRENGVVLTSRTVFFASRAEELRLRGFETYELTDWGQEEWRECLRRVGVGEKAADLERVFNVPDLMKKPYFVRLILSQVDQLLALAAQRKQNRLLATDLYEVFLAQKLADDFPRFRGRKADEDWLRLTLRELALEMVNTYQFRITEDVLKTVVTGVWPDLSGSEVDALLPDLLLCTFFHRVADKLYAFSHPSIVEFLAGEALALATLDATARPPVDRFARLARAYGRRLFYTEVFAFAAELHRTRAHVDGVLDFLGLVSRTPHSGPPDLAAENVIANLLTLLRVMFETSPWTPSQTAKYRDVLLDFLGWVQEDGLQVRYAAAFSLWRCPPDPGTVARVRARYQDEPFNLVRRVIWHTLRFFHRKYPGLIPAADVPPDRPEDAFNDTLGPFFRAHPTAVDSLLSVCLIGVINPIEREAYWIVVIACEIALTSYGEPRIVPALLRDLTAGEEDLRGNARLCLWNFWDKHPDRRGDLAAYAREYRAAGPLLDPADKALLDEFDPVAAAGAEHG